MPSLSDLMSARDARRRTRDLGTYHLRVEFKDGRGYIQRWETGWRFTHGTPENSPLTASPISPTYEDEQALLDNMLSMYEHGNYSCDCNKRLFLARAAQEPEPEDDNQCGDSIELLRLTAIRPDMSEVVLWPRG